eukprot:gene13080-14348_t
MPRTRSQLTALKNRDYQVLPPRNDVSLFQKRGNCIEGLPLAIFLLVKSFLLPSDYRELMNCNLATFQPIKYETVEYNVIGPERWFPISSVHDEMKKQFVKTLINSVKDKSKQISMTMKNIATDLFESSTDIFEGIYALFVTVNQGAKPQRKDNLDFHVFNNIHTLTLDGLLQTNISGGLENIVRLEISNFPNLRFISNINNSKTLRHLTIKSCFYLTQLDFILEDIKTIDINCRNFTCLGELSGDIEEITLITKSEITLKTVNSLTMIAPTLKSLHLNCFFPDEFNDYYMFQSIPSLCLSGLKTRSDQQHPQLSPNFDSKTLRLHSFDLSLWHNSNVAFDRLQDLELHYCSEVVILPVISSLRTLKLVSVWHLRTIPTLMNLQELRIDSCPALDSIASIQPALMNVTIIQAVSLNHVSFDSPIIEKVTLFTCHALTDLSTLRNIPKLLINNCAGITSFEGLGGSSLEEDRRIIDLEYLRNVHDMSGLHHIHSLKISTMNIKNGISDIGHLQLYNCKLSTTNDLKNIRNSLTLTRCKELTKLENLQGIPLIEINHCSMIDYYEGLKNKVLFGEVRACLGPKSFERLRLQQKKLNIKTLIWINPNTNKETIYSLPH